MLRVFFLGLFIAFGAMVSPAQTLSASDAEKIIDYLKKDDVDSAFEFVRSKKTSDSSSRQLREAENFLDAARSYSAQSVELAEKKGDVARVFGFYELALAFYQDAVDRMEQHFQKYGGYRSSYKAAYKAAMCAFWLKDYERAFASLNYIEKTGDTWVKEIGGKNANLLKEFLNAPNNISVRIKFTKGFWIVNYSPIGIQSADAIRFLEETLKLNPTGDETKQIYILIKDTAQTSDDIETAVNYLKKMIGEFPREDFVAESVFSTSQVYFSKQQFAESQKWLDWIIKYNQTNSKFVPLAYLGLSEVYEKLGDEAARIKYLTLAAGDANVAATNRGIMDTSDTRQVAHVRLGKYYQAKRNYEEALKYFTAWQPRSWCGNGQAQSKYERDLYIAESLLGLGREDEALDKHLMPHLEIDGGELYTDTNIPRLVVSLFEKKNALADFLVLIKPHAASKYNSAARIAERLAQIKIDAKNGAIEKLVSEIKHGGAYAPNPAQDFIRENNWQAVAIAEELAKLNGKEFPLLKKRYEELSASKLKSAYEDRIWVIYALGISQAKESEIFLQELLQKTKSEKILSTALGDLIYALSLKKTAQQK